MTGISPTLMRTDEWLNQRFQSILRAHFYDVELVNPVDINYGIRARRRLGSIALVNGRSVIRINRLLAEDIVPQYVVDATIGHEMSHYVHGFGSTLTRKFKHAHRGSVVDIEMDSRGMQEIRLQASAWVRENWGTFYVDECDDLSAKKDLRDSRRQLCWEMWLAQCDRRSIAEIEARQVALLRQLKTSVAADYRMDWLVAGPRHTALSYFYDNEGVLRFHGLLADRKISDAVVDFEIAYWQVRHQVGADWSKIRKFMLQHGLESTLVEAVAWRQRVWSVFRKHHVDEVFQIAEQC